MNRIDRLSAILIMLQSSTIVRVKQIADRFGISIRTVYRDIKALEEVGVPLAGGASEGYSLVEGYKLPPLMFTQEEAFAFVAAEKLVDQFADIGFREGYKSGIEKIRAVMRLAQKETIGDFDNAVASLDFKQPNPAYSQNTMQIVMDAIAKYKIIEVSYFSFSSQQLTSRSIDPIGIFFSLSNWYLIAYCNTKNDYRTFRINRIKDVKMTDNDFSRKHLPLNSFLEKLKNIEVLEEVLIEVNKDDLSLIDETRYHQGLVSEKEEKGIVKLQFMVFSTDRFARWLLSYTDIVEVVHPEKLKARMKGIMNKSKL